MTMVTCIKNSGEWGANVSLNNYRTHWTLDYSSRYGGRGKRTDLGNVCGRLDTLAERLDVSSERKITRCDSDFCLKEFSGWRYY